MGSFTAFLSGLWALVKAAPALYSLWTEIKDLLELSNDKINSKKRAEKIKAAINKANKEKDTSEFDDIFINGNF